MRHQYFISGSLALALAMSLQLCPDAQAQQASISESSQTSVVGPAQVLDSYMKPTVVRTRESTDADGNVERTVEPIVQERHERVMIPSLETTSTDTRSAATTVRTEARQVAQSTSLPVALRKSPHHRRHQLRRTAQNYVHHASVASRVTTTVQPATVEHQETTTERQTILERRDPALDLP